MKRLLFMGAALLVFSCGPNTYITGSWKNPKASTKTYNTIFIAALSGNTIAKSTIEAEMATALQKHAVNTVKSVDEFPPNLFKDSLTKEALLDKVHKRGNDAILTISLLKKTTESRYVPGGYSYAPMTRWGYYGSFGGYYSYWYPYAYSPGYYTQDDIYYLETNLYDSATENLLWSAQSETYSYDGLAAIARDFSKTMVGQMRRDGLLEK